MPFYVCELQGLSYADGAAVVVAPDESAAYALAMEAIADHWRAANVSWRATLKSGCYLDEQGRPTGEMSVREVPAGASVLFVSLYAE
jgi:hypothetical protein